MSDSSPLLNFLCTKKILSLGEYPALVRGHALSHKKRLIEIDTRLAEYRDALLNVQQNMLALEKERMMLSEQLFREEEDFEESIVRALRGTNLGGFGPPAPTARCSPSSARLARNASDPRRVSTSPMRSGLRLYLGFDATGDARTGRIQITSVHSDGPGERAGLKVGDIMCSIDGIAMLNLNEMRVYLYGAHEKWLSTQSARKESHHQSDTAKLRFSVTLSVLRPDCYAEEYVEKMLVLYPSEVELGS